MNVSERGPRIRVTELLLRDFRCVAGIDDETGDAVTKRMKSATRNVERVEYRPELILHDFVARGRPAVPSGEEEAIRIGPPLLLVASQDAG